MTNMFKWSVIVILLQRMIIPATANRKPIVSISSCLYGTGGRVRSVVQLEDCSTSSHPVGLPSLDMGRRACSDHAYLHMLELCGVPGGKQRGAVMCRFYEARSVAFCS